MKNRNCSRHWWKVLRPVFISFLINVFLCSFVLGEDDFKTRIINHNFQYFLTAIDYNSGLVYDHILFTPDNDMKIGKYTSPTVIGLWMVLLADVITGDLKIDDFTPDDAWEILSTVIRTLERIPRWKGLFYWYELKESITPTDDRAISVYDNGNLTISMAVAYSALSSTDNELDSDLAERIWRLLIAQEEGWRKFFDERRHLLYGLYKSGKPVRNLWLDRFYTEARNAVIAGILIGKLPQSIWVNLLRERNCPRGEYTLSSGRKIEFLKPYQGAFQAWMSLLFIPEMELSQKLRRMHCNYAQIQIDYALNSEIPLLRSACADPYIQDRYFYEPCVGVFNASEDWVRSDIGSPYATALLYTVYPKISLKLFKIALDKFPQLWGPYGFWDSIGENGVTSRVYIALDQLQLILSFVADDNQRYFMKFVEKIGKKEELEELYHLLDKQHLTP